MKNLLILAFVIIAFCFTSCIELFETTTIKTDKSGRFEAGLDLGLLGMGIDAAGKYLDNKSINQIKAFPTDAASKVKDIKGISNIKPNIGTNGKYSISFEYNNPKALNKALYALGDQKKKFFAPSLTKIGKHKIRKRNVGPLVRYYAKKQIGKLKDQKLLNHISYKAQIITPANITASKNPLTQVNGNTAQIKMGITELLKEKTNIGMQLKY